MFAARQPHHKNATGTNSVGMPTGGTRTRYMLSGSEEVADLNADRSLIARYIPGAAIDERLAQVDANGAVTFMHNDKQNSVIAISDAVGNPIVRRGYGTYGETDPAQMVGTTSAGTSPHPFGYTGRRWDPDLNLYYYRARWYDPALGTFLQTDPIGSLDYINLHSYVGLEPGNGTDPTGKFVQAIPIIVCAGGGCEAASAAAAAATALTVGVISKVIIDNVLGDTAPLLFPQPNPTPPQGSTVSESRGKDSGEHTKNARPSTKGKHEAGRARQRQDRGGERGDESRRPPRKPPLNHRGPWPPR